jgi:PAS domain S-box-containing protein
MKTSNKPSPINEALRKRAEEQVAGDLSVADTSVSGADVQALLQDLQVHQIELELQNEELLLAQAELKAVLEQYRDLYDYAPVGYFTFDQGGFIRKINLTGAAMLMIERQRLIDRRFQLYLTNETRGSFTEFLERVFQTTTRQTCEVVLHIEEGKPVFIRIEAEASEGGLLCLAAVTNITELKQMTQTQAERDVLRTLVQTIPDLIWLKDADGVYQFCNPMFEHFFGAPAADIIGRTDYDFVDKELADLFRENDRKAAAVGKPSKNEEDITFADDGHHAFLETIKTPMFDSDGKLIGVLGIARDITELKTLEAQLLQSQKMEAVGQLAGGVAHDFNNILTAIIGFSSLMEMQMEKDSPLRDNLSHVLAAADRAADLTRSLLAFSRKQIMKFQPVNLSRIIKNIEKFLQRIIGEDIAFKMIFHQDLLTVNADCGQIEQVLMNLAVNARDAMPHGGMLTIETGFALMDTDFIKTHGFGEAGEYALVTITDSGAGMDEITRKRLFEPFFTTKELGKGTGLGLSIVYGIVKQHNGFVGVESEQGAGTTFSIYLPLIKTDIEGKAAHTDEILRKGTETILLVDDDVLVLDLAETVLDQSGYTVITALNGLDAVKIFSENREMIDLVILDVIMPKMNGKEALAEIRKIRPDIKAIFISGYTTDIIHSRGMLDESMEFIAKPLRPINLLQKVREVLDGTKPE